MSRTLSLATEAFNTELYSPVKLSGTETVNELFSYSLIIKTPDKSNLSSALQDACANADLTSWLGKPIQVGLELDGKSIQISEVIDTIRQSWNQHIGQGTRYIGGVIKQASFLYDQGRSSYYSVEITPKLIESTLKSNYRIFQDQTVIEVLKALIDPYALSVEWRLIQQDKAHRYPKRGGALQGLGYQDWLSLKNNWANIDSKTALPPEAKKMFEHYVHDSWAWFKLAGLEAEQATDAEFKRLEKKADQIAEKNKKILSENTVLLGEYLEALKKDPMAAPPKTRPLEKPLPTSEQELLEAYRKNDSQLDGMETLSAREPSKFNKHPRAPIWGKFQGGGGYLRYRVIYMGGNANHVHGVAPLAQSGPTRRQVIENFEREHGIGD